ncbi:hypothetical protein TCE0_004r00347 [Talaromyces pinophilus]|jgi:hypothetical protein|uniref:Uncharacterized protein n=1 Tax=Talaromyces pinophilus TaxID=128442 RepID=A0A0B8N0A4_TALPI|nr:hypothetical protein TCE0_004r00347 [Talaromyces pinophilus]
MVISQIISWPKELTEFRLHKSWGTDTSYQLDMPIVQSWLATHKTTLKYIKIEELQFGPPLHRALESPLGLSVAEFTSLEHLHLSRWLWGRQEGLMMAKPLDVSWARAEAELLLLAPKLRVFEWDFTMLGRGGPRVRWTAFGANDEEWLRIFAQVAICQRDRHSLEEIRIQFEPEDMGSGRESEVYPWDRMDRVREEVVQLSGGLVTLTYNKPRYSREEWKEHLEGERKLEMERETQDT